MALTRRSLLGALAATATGLAPGQARATARDPVAALWTGMELMGQDGRSFALRDLPAPATLLHLWASWCPACLGEMASLADAASSVGGRRMDIVLVSHPEFWAADQAFAQRRGLPFRLAVPTASNASAVLDAALLEQGAYVVPRSLLFAGAGHETVWSHKGAVPWSSSAALARLRGPANAGTTAG